MPMTAPPIARATDPSTSHAGAADVAIRANSQKHLLLLEFYKAAGVGLTADEAGNAAGLLHTGYWKRVSDLDTAGLIVAKPLPGAPDLDVTRPGRSGSAQLVRVITARGVQALKLIGRRP